MSRGRSKQTTSSALEAIEAQVSAGKPAPEVQPSHLEFSKVRTCPAVFQHRRPHDGDSAHHIRAMADALSKGTAKSLDAITVWWDGKGWTCIDGHHRLEAYRRSGVEPWASIPVKVHPGTLEEAIAEAARGNTRTKLPMTAHERMRAAWRLTCTTSLSKAAVVEACGVGDGTVARMRKVLKALQERGEEAPCDLSWWEAQAKAKGEDLPEGEEMSDEAKQAMAKAWALAMRKSLPPGFETQEDIVAMALEILSPRLPVRLQEWWGAGDDDEDEGL